MNGEDRSPRGTQRTMHPGEHAVMARVEADHWWYRGLRDVMLRTIERVGLNAAPSILDAGCGTGENLRALAGLGPAYLGGFDLSEEAVALARTKLPDAELYVSDIRAPELRRSNYDLIVSLDVIYIPGVEASLAGLQALTAALRPGGLFVLNLPAYDWLFSEHDVAIHTSERYTAGRVRALLDRLDLIPELLTYRLCLLFPAVVASRLPSMLRRRGPETEARSDLHRPPGPAVNGLLRRIVVQENRLIASGVRWPWGSSVFAIGRRR